MKLKERYYIKIVPQRGETVHRFEVTRKHVVSGAIALGVAIAGSVALSGTLMLRAHAAESSYRHQAAQQSAALQQIDRQTGALRKQLQNVQRQNVEIQQLIGVKPHPSKLARTSLVRAARGGDFAAVSSDLDRLRVASAATARESDAIRTLTMRVLNMRHLSYLARAAALAAIPSIDPVAGALVVGCFCYRTSPDVEFHEGVDLGADEGAAVHASAAGTVVAAGWDGSYGKKIVVDHGNGYQSWYAHLSEIDVRVGQTVYKGQSIGLVGETGFATGPHLHYQLMHEGKAIDPTPFLHGVPANVLASLP
ncbi:MAG TPA: M23 family metallopeptidase [Candidatus Baltobacteraceae bacterium]